MARILIAEDETRIASFIAKGLSANGFTATVVVDGPSALDYAMTGDFDLVVLDIGLPGFDGFEVLRRLRAAGNPIAIVVLTARDSVADTVAGLEGGADDYIPKPFRFEELLARVRRRLVPDRAAEPTVLHCGGLISTCAPDKLLRAGRWSTCPPASSPWPRPSCGTMVRCCPASSSFSHVWGYDYDPGSNVVDVYVLPAPRLGRRPVDYTAWTWGTHSTRCPDRPSAGPGHRGRMAPVEEVAVEEVAVEKAVVEAGMPTAVVVESDVVTAVILADAMPAPAPSAVRPANTAAAVMTLIELECCMMVSPFTFCR